MNDKFDIIVVGAGIGGLVSAALASKYGKKVLIVDKNPFAGGYVSSMKQNGFVFDQGIIFISGVKNNGEFYKILEELDLDKKIELVCFDVLGKICSPNYEVKFRADRKRMAEELASFFPNESESISNFLWDCEKLLDEIVAMPAKSMILPKQFPTFFKYRTKMLEDVINEHFQNPTLKSFFLSHPFFLSEPKDSVLVSALRMASALAGDLFYPKGGMQSLADAFVEKIQNYGGEILLNTEVDKVLINDNAAYGVSHGGYNYFADHIISDIDPWHLQNNMLNDEFKTHKYFQSLNQNTVGRSAFMLYLGVTMEIDSSNCYLSYVPEDIPIDGFNHKTTGIAILIPSLIDPSMAPDNSHTLIIEVPAPYSYKGNWMATANKSDYEFLIDEVSDAVIKSAEKVIPNLSKNIVHQGYATPISFEKLTYNREGSTMGWTKTPKNMQKMWGRKFPIQNLYQTGQWSGPFGGVLGSSLYGQEIARAICQK
jgi:phytoene dehydrogenase-like protein